MAADVWLCEQWLFRLVMGFGTAPKKEGFDGWIGWNIKSFVSFLLHQQSIPTKTIDTKLYHNGRRIWNQDLLHWCWICRWTHHGCYCQEVPKGAFPTVNLLPPLPFGSCCYGRSYAWPWLFSVKFIWRFLLLKDKAVARKCERIGTVEPSTCLGRIHTEQWPDDGPQINSFQALPSNLEAQYCPWG